MEFDKNRDYAPLRSILWFRTRDSTIRDKRIVQYELLRLY